MTEAMLIPILFSFTLFTVLAIAVWQLVSLHFERQNINVKRLLASLLVTTKSR